MEPPPFGDGNFSTRTDIKQYHDLQWSHRPSVMETLDMAHQPG